MRMRRLRRAYAGTENRGAKFALCVFDTEREDFYGY